MISWIWKTHISLLRSLLSADRAMRIEQYAVVSGTCSLNVVTSLLADQALRCGERPSQAHTGMSLTLIDVAPEYTLFFKSDPLGTKLDERKEKEAWRASAST